MHAFVVHRDRPTYLARCVAALQAGGVTTIHVVDHGSTYPAAVELLDDWASADRAVSGITVHRHGDDHPRDLWAAGGVIERVVSPDQRHIVTDCDVVPDDDCPADWIERLWRALDTDPRLVKAGLSLRTDDLPEGFPHRTRVRTWETQYRLPHRRADFGGWPGHYASIDTTMAMYRGPGPFRLDPAVRLDVPYQARHLAWYEDPADLGEELTYYRAHAVPGISHWTDPDGFTGTYGLEAS